MYVPPWTIISGLGALSRSEVCNLVATFGELSLLSVTSDSASDRIASLKRGKDEEAIPAFAKRVDSTARTLDASDTSIAALRIRLWYMIVEALDGDPTLPLSTKTANYRCAAIAFKAAEAAPRVAQPRSVGSIASRTWKRLRGGEEDVRPDFPALVEAEAETVAKAMAELAVGDALTPEQKSELERRVREHIGKLPPELRDEAMRKAMRSGDGAALALLASGSSLLGVGLGVHLAGFSAYILAAQASAFIPLLSGPAAASTLFMLANPVFSIPVLMGGAWFLNNRFAGAQKRQLASRIAIHLALRGMGDEDEGLQRVLAEFRLATAADFSELPAAFAKKEVSRRSIARRRAVEAKAFGAKPPRQRNSLLEGIIARGKGDTAELAAVGAMTFADMIYNVVSIDPTVLQAADFSRSAEISDIFAFGAFAERFTQMSGRMLTGAESGLRGYVAEQIVVARLVENGHVVSLPATSNNPGFDVIVDGNQFQVKCLADLDGLREHFEKYPDLPVYANGELAEAVLASGEEWADKVFYVEGFDKEIAELVMQASLEAGAELGDTNVPFFAMTVSSARNLYAWWRGRMPLSDVPVSVIADSGIKGGLAAAGGISGKLLGLAAFGPAGAMVLGGALGVGALLGAGWMKDQTTRLLATEWADELDKATEKLRVGLIREIGGKIAALEDRQRAASASQNIHAGWLEARFADDVIALREASYELEADISALLQPARAARCLELMKETGVHPLNVDGAHVEVLKAMADRPSLPAAVSTTGLKVWDAVATLATRERK